MTYTTRSTCRACGGEFDPILSLGTLVPSDFIKPKQPDPDAVPLSLVICQACELVQLEQTLDRSKLFGKVYWYRSGVNEVMKAELADVVRAGQQRVTLMPSSIVVDVGANDGTLLAAYPPRYLRVAIEPSPTFHDRLHEQADAVIIDFFPSRATGGIAPKSVDLLTSIAMFYAADDPKAFVAEVDRVLARDGLWICQMQDLGQMVKATAFDNITFEHVAYYSTGTFASLLAGFDLCVTEIESRSINGGSLRFYVRRRHHERTAVRLPDAWLNRDALSHFAWRVGEYREQLRGTLHQMGQPVDLYAASTKSSTLLQYCGLDSSLIRCAAERTPEKIGRVTSGTRIPIISEAEWRDDPAPVCLLGAWQFKEAFLRREAAYLARGGCFVAPLPAVEVILGSRSAA